MFLKFWLCNEIPRSDRTVSGGFVFGNKASTHGVNTRSRQSKMQFEYTKSRIISDIADNTDSWSNYQRSSLIHLPDEVMFQLEVLAVVENSWCVYNMYNNIIAFGSTKENALSASKNEGDKTTSATSLQGSSLDSYIFNFYITNEVPQIQDYGLVTPDAFYISVLNELKPYIIHEKIEQFRLVANKIDYFYKDVLEYIDTYALDNNTPDVNIEIPEVIISNAINMFMNDDEDIFGNINILGREIEIIRQFIVKILSITNETL